MTSIAASSLGSNFQIAGMDDRLFIRGSFGILGGIGHALVDLYTALLLSDILQVQFLYDGIETIPIGRCDKNISGIGEHERRHPWGEVFGLGRCFPSVESARGLYDETIRLSAHGPWSLFNIGHVREMKALVQKCRNERRRVLFEILGNERLWYWQVVSWELHGLVDQGTTRRFRQTIRAPFRRRLEVTRLDLVTHRRPKLSVHIRNSGKWPDTLESCAVQKAGAAKIAQWLDVPVDIYSEGQEADLERIHVLYDGVPANIHFNEDTAETFIAMATSDVLLGGGSSFFLHAGLLTPGMKVVWHQPAMLEMVSRLNKQEPMNLDEEWLTVNRELDRGQFMNRFERKGLP